MLISWSPFQTFFGTIQTLYKSVIINPFNMLIEKLWRKPLLPKGLSCTEKLANLWKRKRYTAVGHMTDASMWNFAVYAGRRWWLIHWRTLTKSRMTNSTLHPPLCSRLCIFPRVRVFEALECTMTVKSSVRVSYMFDFALRHGFTTDVLTLALWSLNVTLYIYPLLVNFFLWLFLI